LLALRVGVVRDAGPCCLMHRFRASPLLALHEVAFLNAEGMTCNSHGRKSMVKEQQTPQSPEGTTEVLSVSACRPFGTIRSLFAVSPD